MTGARWAGIALAVLGLHAGALAVLARTPGSPPPAAEAGDAVAVDLDPVEGVAAPPDQAEPADPAEDASVAAAVAADAAARQATPDAPTAPLTPTTPTPPQTPIPPVPSPPPPEPVTPPTPAPSDAVEATPPPPPTPPVQAAPAPASQASAASAAAEDAVPVARRASTAREAAWRGRLVAHINRFRRFPPGLRSGTARIGFTIDGEGRVTAVAVVTSSGEAALDDAARSLVSRASPFPTPPAGVPARDLSFVVPVHYDARRP